MKRFLIATLVAMILAVMVSSAFAEGQAMFNASMLFRPSIEETDVVMGEVGFDFNWIPGCENQPEGQYCVHATDPMWSVLTGIGIQPTDGLIIYGRGMAGMLQQAYVSWGAEVGIEWLFFHERFKLVAPVKWWGSKEMDRIVLEPEFQFRLGKLRQFRLIACGHYFNNFDTSGEIHYAETNGKVKTADGGEEMFTSFGWGSEWGTAGGGIGFNAFRKLDKEKFGDLEFRFTAEGGRASGRILNPAGNPPPGYRLGDDPTDYPDSLVYLVVDGIIYRR